MKKEYILYAQRLDTIGDLVISISNLIKSPEEFKTMSPDSIKIYKKDLDETVERFEYAKDSIADLTVPSIIQTQHGELLKGFGGFVQSIKTLNGSVKINKDNKVEFNANEYINGLSLQKESVNKIEQVTIAIGDIFLVDEVNELAETETSEDTHSNK
ncbi:hypothetical protein [Priestia megaterium]|uniref:hypothetical protein n=1 Tax=Priestia megaterium TaxID=1404 RepID=UPI000BFD63DB|nr:hypothetical protein [Priestia megaterium]PGT75543.1 hypothetical protein COD15_07315 [Priestia megaterium]